MEEKIDKPLLHAQVWVNGQITIGVAISYSQMIHVARVPSPMWDREPNWDPALVLGLAH